MIISLYNLRDGEGGTPMQHFTSIISLRYSNARPDPHATGRGKVNKKDSNGGIKHFMPLSLLRHAEIVKSPTGPGGFSFLSHTEGRRQIPSKVKSSLF